MKKFLLRFSALPVYLLLITLCGCPYSSSYKLDNEPAFPVDSSILGSWATIINNNAGKALPLKLTITARTDNEYNLWFTGNIRDLKKFGFVKDDTLKCTGFISEVASRQFINIQAKGQYYIAEFIFQDDKVSILPLCEHFTNRIIKSGSQLRLGVVQHFQTRLYPLYDDEFCLKNLTRVN